MKLKENKYDFEQNSLEKGVKVRLEPKYTNIYIQWKFLERTFMDLGRFSIKVSIWNT